MRFYIGESNADRPRAISRAFDRVGISEALSKASKVFVKPNFTFPRHIRGVTTSPDFLRDILQVLSESGAEVFVGESNGGYGSFLAKEAFEGHRLFDICRDTKTNPVNLSEIESRVYEREVAGKATRVRLPRLLVEEVEFTISVPVMKVHAMTTVSLSVKNLWGCCPLDLRLLEHAKLSWKLRLIAELIHARFGVIDAIYGLDHHGPMEGDARFIGKFIVGDDLYGLDWIAAKMMGFHPEAIHHLSMIDEKVRDAVDNHAVDANADWGSTSWNFSIRLNKIDALSLVCFHSDTLSKIVFDSPLTKPIYAFIGRKPRRKLG